MLREFAPIYQALAAAGIGYAEARTMELWAVGAALGLTERRSVEEGEGLVVTSELLAARARARAEGRSLADLPQPSRRGGRPPSTIRGAASPRR